MAHVLCVATKDETSVDIMCMSEYLSEYILLCQSAC
jgi:hypothetical protein